MVLDGYAEPPYSAQGDWGCWTLQLGESVWQRLPHTMLPTFATQISPAALGVYMEHAT